MPSPSFRSKVWSAGTDVGVTPSEPAGAASGDIICACVVVNAGHSGFTPPAGWSQKGVGLDCTNFTAYFYWVRRGASAPSYAFSWTGSQYFEIVVGAYSGARSSGDPFDDFQESFLSPQSTSGPDCPSATAATAATTATAWGCNYAGSSSTWTAPTGYTLRSGAGGDDLGFADKALASAGSDDPDAFGGFGVFSGYRYGATAILASASAGGPTITAQPSSSQVAEGATTSFSVTATASGGGTLSYQWKKNGTNVSGGSGGTTASYTTPALALSDDLASYTCDVTETGGTSDGTTTSSAATLYVGWRIVGAGTPAYSTSGGTSVAPDYSTLPAIQAGDEILLVVAQKPSTANSGSVTTPTGYTLITSLTGAGGYATTLGNNTGNTNLFVYRKDSVAGTESGTLSVILGTNNIASATFVLLRPPSGQTVSAAASTGSDTTSGNVSITCAADPGIAAGDAILALFNGSSALATYSAEAVTTTGVTYGTVTELAEPSTTVGNDVAGFIASAKATAGTSSAAPVFTATTSGTTTNARGPGILVRMRIAAASSSTAPATTRSAAKSSATTTYATSGTVSSRSLASSAPSAEITGFITTPATTRSLASSGATSTLPAPIVMTSSRALAKAAAVALAASSLTASTRSIAHSAAPEAAAEAIITGASSELSGDNQAVATPLQAPSRSLAASGAPAVVASQAAAPAASRSLAASAATAATPVTAQPSSRPLGASREVATAAASVPTAARSLATSGASVESTAITSAPAASRSLATSSPTVALAVGVSIGSRTLVASGPIGVLSGFVATPAASRSLASSAACTVTPLGAQSACRGAQASASVAETPQAVTSATRTAFTGGFSAEQPAAKLAASSIPRFRSALLAVPGVVSSAVRDLALSGAPVDAVAVYTVAASPSRSLASSGPVSVWCSFAITGPSSSASLSRSWASVSFSGSPFIPLPVNAPGAVAVVPARLANAIAVVKP